MSKVELKNELQDQVYSCAQCGYCNNVCPIYEQIGWESSSPRGRMFLLKELLKNKKIDLQSNKIKLTPEVVERFYQCTTCGACQSICQTDIETIEVWESLRKDLVKLGVGPYGAQRFFPKNVYKYNNPYGELPEKRINWLPKDTKINDHSPIGFFVGCTSSYRTQELAVLAVKIFNYMNLEFNLLGSEEYCCGSPLIRTGQDEADILIEENGERKKIHFNIADTIRHNIEKIHEKGIKTLVVQCAGCFKTISQDWPRYYKEKVKFKVVHISQFLADQIKKNKLRFIKPINKTITFHDPCHLGRHMKVYDEPRFVIQSIPGVKLVEMRRTRETSQCCGAGGGVKAAFSELATNIAETRITDAESINSHKRNIEELLKSLHSIVPSNSDTSETIVALQKDIEEVAQFMDRPAKSVDEKLLQLLITLEEKIQSETDVLLKQSIEMASKRVKEALEVGAEIIVTSCPFCKLNLTSGANHKNSPVLIKNILEIVAEACAII